MHIFLNKLDLLQEKEFSIPDELGKDAQSVAALQRRHANFEHDLLTLGAQVGVKGQLVTPPNGASFL